MNIKHPGSAHSSDTITLNGGEKIKAKRNVTGRSNLYNQPEKIDIPKGTVLQIPKYGTNRGDVFCQILEGECILHCAKGEKVTLKIGDTVGLQEGHKTSYPQDVGLVSTDVWEIVSKV